MRQHPHLATVTQKQFLPGRIKMNFVTYCNIWLKCYITFCDIVADGKRGSNVLAKAIDKLWLTLGEKLKNIYSFFTFTVISLLSECTSQDNLLSLLNSKIPTISLGIVVRRLFEFGFCCIILDFTSNNFIPPILSFFVNIFVYILYIFCLLYKK